MFKYQVVSVASNTIHVIHIHLLMTEFVKAALKHFDFTTPKGLKITPRAEQKIVREEQEREDNRVEG